MGDEPEYKIITSEKDGILKLVFSGEVARDSVSELDREINEIIKTNNAQNILIDVRALKGRYGYTEVYFRVSDYPSHRLGVNTACVDLPEHADYQKFHEHTSVNAGLTFKWFTEVDEAHVWLRSLSKK
jgi:hypothetical protein